MSQKLIQRYPTLDAVSRVLHYLHLDLVLTGLVLTFILGSGLANHMKRDGRIFLTSSLHLPKGQDSSQAEAGTTLKAKLAPPMQAALENVAQRYRVSAEALQPVFEAIQLTSQERKLDPLLLIAVISVESRFNPFSQSAMGAQGLMQIIPRFHNDKIPPNAGDQPFLDPVTNIVVGARILQEAIGRQGGLVEGLQYYAGALDDEDKAYATKVLAEKMRLEQVTRRGNSAIP